MLKPIRTMLVVAMLSSMATYAFAEDPAAPVFDADSLSQPPASDSQPSGAEVTDANASDVGSQDEPPVSRSKPSPVQALPAASNPATVQTDLPQTLTLDQRVKKVEQQVNNLQSAGSANKVEELQNEVQTLRGQVDDLTHQLQQVQQKLTEQQNLSTALEKRTAKLTSAKPDTTTAPKTDEAAPMHVAKPPKAAPAADADSDVEADKPTAKSEDAVQPGVAEEQQTYQTAYDLIKAKKYNDAIAALQLSLIHI